jgi:hypothetical protein
MSIEEREDLRKSLEISTSVSSEQILALKANLSIPWNKIRAMRRFLQYLQ